MKNLPNDIINDLFVRRPHNRIAGSIDSNLSPALQGILSDSKQELSVVAPPGAGNAVSPKAQELRQIVKASGERSGYRLSDFETENLTRHLESSFSPLGILQPLCEDTQVSDIIVRSYNRIDYQCGRRNFKTGLAFADQADYESFVERLLAKQGRSCSVKQPIVDVMLNEVTRLNVVHQSLARGGPYLTIRLNRFRDVSLEDLHSSGLAPLPILEYLRLAVRSGLTILIAGEVGTGKTTLGRALASQIAVEDSVLIIEDTPEILITHPHVRTVCSRTENSEGLGKIGPAECIRAGMRMAMGRIIFGEIRDSEAAEAFIDVCSSGHSGLSTIHARSADDAVLRLEMFLGRAQRGVANEVFQQQISSAIQLIVHVGFCPQTKQRRITQVKELGRVTDGRIKQSSIFSYFYSNGPLWRLDHRLSNFRERFADIKSSYSFSALPDLFGINEPAQEAATAWS